ncbi:MAG: hypothetical protein PHN88_09275 [Ignavibacteria bacterium]|jgi:hypothetical protein|nr:hypothetical protein [Ignavibacteria bacterium]
MKIEVQEKNGETIYFEFPNLHEYNAIVYYLNSNRKVKKNGLFYINKQNELEFKFYDQFIQNKGWKRNKKTGYLNDIDSMGYMLERSDFLQTNLIPILRMFFEKYITLYFMWNPKLYVKKYSKEFQKLPIIKLYKLYEWFVNGNVYSRPFSEKIYKEIITGKKNHESENFIL